MEIDTDCAEDLPWRVLVCHIVDKIILFWNRSVHLGRIFFVKIYKYYS